MILSALPVTLLLVISSLSLSSSSSSTLKNNELSIIKPPVILTHVSFPLTLELPTLLNGGTYSSDLKYQLFLLPSNSNNNNDSTSSNNIILQEGWYSTLDDEGNTQSSDVNIQINNLVIKNLGHGVIKAIVYSKDEQWENTIDVFLTPGILSITPPIITLLLSSLCSNVILALLFGIWTGSTIVYKGNLLKGLYHTFDEYWVNSFTSTEHAGVLLFTLILGGCIGIVQKGGGGHGLAKTALKYMTTRYKMQWATVLLCSCIFFDDFSCILIVGNSLKSVLSSTGVSNEKFAILIHTMAVCLPSIAPVSSWVGVEIGYIAAQIKDLGLEDDGYDPFVMCLKSIGYRFFPLLMILFLLVLIACQKDFGPVFACEQRAVLQKNKGFENATTDDKDNKSMDFGPLDPIPGNPQRPMNAVIPFVLIVFLTFFGMIYDGFNTLSTLPPEDEEPRTLLNALSHSDSIAALLRASSIGCITSLVLVLTQRLLTLQEGMQAWMDGVKDILEPTMVLLLAWALGDVIKDVQAAEYLASVIKEGLPSCILPTVTAILCYVVSFATGSSFGTMAIMFPIISPLAYKISNGDSSNLLQCFGAILGASTFGNTCSPIADTTILTALSTSISLQVHVDTILPYSVFIATVSLLFGTLPVGLGWYNGYIAFVVMIVVIVAFVLVFGKTVKLDINDDHAIGHCNGHGKSNGYTNENHTYQNGSTLSKQENNDFTTEAKPLLSTTTPCYV